MRWALAAWAMIALNVAVHGGEVVEIDGLKSKAPDDWKKATPATSMQYAVFTMPKVEGDSEDAKLIVYFFGPGGGGGENANVTRWKGMFKAPAGENAKVDKFKAGGADVTTVDLTGTYLFKAMPMDPKTTEKPNFRMIGVIFASPKGPYYMRFVGPEKTVAKYKTEFDEWLKNFK